MAIKSDSHIFGGMQRDFDIAKHQSQFLYDALNIRFTPIEGDTMMALTNERGPLETYSLDGKYLGHYTFNNFIIVFTKDEESNSPDKIYQIYPETQNNPKLLYEGNLGLSLDNPLETLGVYENDYLSKVYWVDGINQPRVIKLITPREGEEEYNYYSRIFPNSKGIDTQFDFVSSLQLNEDISVERILGEGIFAPGVIQYAFAYYKLNGQESNIFYTTPLNYITFTNRAGSPEDRVANSFKIIMKNLDATHFDFIRIFSIHRTSYNSTPTVRRLVDLSLANIQNNTLQFTDNGGMGDNVDPTELLYIGGEQIIAQTITAKDQTLFLGNLQLQRHDDLQTKLGLSSPDFQFNTIEINDQLEREGTGSGYYYYTNGLLNQRHGFKNREHYRLGIQFQHITGKWSLPIYLDDYTINSQSGPSISEGDTIADFTNLGISSTITLNTQQLNTLINNDYVKIRPICVFPNINDRLVLTQGILCPTVYNYCSRVKNAPFTQSSWFFRLNPNKEANSTNYPDNTTSAWVEFRHNRTLRSEMVLGGEIQGFGSAQGAEKWITSSQYFNTYPLAYAIDQSILTMHSPEIEFDTDINFLTDVNWKLRLVGIANFTSSYGDIDIQTSSPAITGSGFNHYTVGHQDSDQCFKSMVATKSWIDGPVVVTSGDDTKYEGLERQENYKNFIVYPWQRSGSLNNDVKRPADKGARSAELKNKKLSNLRFSKNNTWFNNQINCNYSITPIVIFDSDQPSLVKLQNMNPTNTKTLAYYGNIDTMVIQNISNYKSKIEGNDENTIAELNDLGGGNTLCNDDNISIRIKYKSTKHIVFGLKNNSGFRNTILPSLGNINRVPTDSEYYTHLPEWYSDDSDSDNELQEAVDAFWTLRDGYIYFNQWFNYRKTVYEQNPQDYENQIIINFGDNRQTGILYKLIRNQIAWAGQGAQEDEFDWYYRSLNDQEKKYAYYQYGQSIYKHIGNSNLEFYCQLEDWAGESSSESNYIPFQNIINVTPEYPYLFLGELYREPNESTDFGGKNPDALLHNTWLPAGKAIRLPELQENVNSYTINLIYDQGDTWYTRYDCLKTYPFTEEDENSIIEVGSFMCESRVNGDGRYDKNRGEVNNLLNFRPTNFNLINPVYTQPDNFFSYKIIDEELAGQNLLPNTITWSKINPQGNDIDLWTNITMANTLDLDGVQGQIRSLQLFNNNIYCFQDTAISNILFNSRVQIPVSDGVPIEISNGQKVEGSTYITTNYGCTNKKSIVITPSGVYFLDTISNQLMNIGEGISSVSGTHGFSHWFKSKDNHDTLKSSYDFVNNDLYLNWDDTSLVFSEALGQFTSFMSYEKVHSIFNTNKNIFCIRDDNNSCKIYKMFNGAYCYFFGEPKEYKLKFISNQDSAIDKIFLNLEGRVDFKDINTGVKAKKFFDYIRVTNEYQDTGETSINTNTRRVVTNTSGRKKFRIWRTEIPRALKNNKRSLDRIRNTWASIELGMFNLGENATSDQINDYINTQMTLHDIEVQYFLQ